LFALFYGLSVAGFQGGLAEGHTADLWFMTWVASGSLAGIAWCCALARPALWIALWRDSGPAIAWGLPLGCAIWESAEILTGQLFEVGRRPTLVAVVAMLRGLGYDAVFSEATARIGTPAFSVRMSAACFGYEGIAMVIVFSAVYLFALRKELAFPRSLVLVFLAVAASWWMNVVRVLAMILLGAYRGAYAVEGFHSVAGWLYFAAIAAGIVALSQRPWFANVQERGPKREPAMNPAAPYLVPLMVLVATAMVARIFAGSFESLYPLRIIAVAAVLSLYRNRVATLGWRGSAWATGPGALIFFLWMALEPPPSPSSIPGGLALLPGWAAAGWLAFRALGSSLTVPLAEELAFRGYLVRKLTAADFETVSDGRFSLFAVIASSLAFGAMHGRFLAGTLAGVALAITFRRRGQLADAVVAHGTANALIAVYVLSTNRWSVWN
jgi:exosortase E/protease (VPEID-CTERM system)